MQCFSYRYVIIYLKKLLLKHQMMDETDLHTALLSEYTDFVSLWNQDKY